MKVLCSLRETMRHSNAPNNGPANQRIRRLGDALDAAYILRTEVPDVEYDLLIQWGFKRTAPLMHAYRNARPYVIVDMGYWENLRSDSQSISINGLHGLGIENQVLDQPPRFHPQIQQWDESGEGCLIVGQLNGDASLRGENTETWQRKIAAECVDKLHMPALLRPHPKMINPWEPQLPPIESALDETLLCVTHSSTVGVTSLLRGVLTVATHPGSPVYRQVAHTIDSQGVRMPGRQSFFHSLSYKDYELSKNDEVVAAAKYITDHYDFARAHALLGHAEEPGRRL